MDLGSLDNFCTMGTLGIEEEYFVVDSNGLPINDTEKFMSDTNYSSYLSNRVDYELFKFIVECSTPIASSLNEAKSSLYDMRKNMIDHAHKHNLELSSAGLHPSAIWRELDHVTKPRYRQQLDRIQYPQHRNITAGMHIHFGVDDPNKAMWMSNQCRPYLPLLLALSANSPYWNGFDTGLQSTRSLIFESLPNTGMPHTFSDMDEYLHFEKLMVDTNSVVDRGALWHDVRPHTSNGTVELRIMDAQTDPKKVIHLLEYVYHLLTDLSDKYDDGDSGTSTRPEILSENKWRALRYGFNSKFINWDGSSPISLSEIVEMECQRLGNNGLFKIYDAEPTYSWQRAQYNKGGLEHLCRSLIISN